MGPVDRVLRFTELALLRLNNSNHRHPVVLTVEVDYTRPAMLSHFCFMLQPQNCHGESIQVFETFQLIAHVRYQLCAHQSRVRSQKHKYDNYPQEIQRHSFKSNKSFETSHSHSGISYLLSSYVMSFH